MKIARYYVGLFLLLIAQFTTLSLSAQLRKIFSDTQTSNSEADVLSFYSPSQGYVSFNGYIGYTSDSGHTFVKKFITPANVNLNGYTVSTNSFTMMGVRAFSHDTLMAYGSWDFIPTVLYSIDGGNTFKMVMHSNRQGTFSDVNMMIFPQDHTTGYLVDGARIMKTTDRGLTWTQVYSAPLSPVYFMEEIEAPNNSAIYASTYSSVTNIYSLLRSLDGGSTWQTIPLPAHEILRHMSFLNSTKGWICTLSDDPSTSWGNIYYTSNSGASWTQMGCTPFFYETPEKIKFVNDSVGYRLTGFYQVYKTSDSGRVWERLPRDNNFYYAPSTLWDIQVWDQNQLWVSGGGSLIEISTNAGGRPYPTSDFTTDTTNFYLTNRVNLYTCSNHSYQFTWLVNGVVISHEYNTSYLHNPASLRDTITLAVSNGFNADTARDYIDFNPPPVCAGGSITFTSNVSGASYQWQQNTGSGYTNLSNATNVSGAATASLNLSLIPSSWNGYKYRCLAGTQTSAEYLLTVKAAPTPNAGPDKTTCAGTGVQIGTASVSGQTYSWTPATGLSASNIAQPVATPSATTIYQLTVSAQGCSAADTVVVTVTPAPSAPTITQLGNVLFSSASSGNQWYLNGVLVAGATNPTYAPPQNGIYTVVSTVNGCASAASAPVNLVLTAINSPVLNNEITVAPNPVSDRLVISHSGNAASFEVSVEDMAGRSVVAHRRFSSSYTLDMRSLNAGLYVVRITNVRTGEHVQRLIVKE